MGFAVPALTTAGKFIGGSLLGKAVGGAKKPSADQADTIREQIATARMLRGQGESLFNTASPLLTNAAGYYNKLVGGDLGALREATSPERSAINETFLGAERGINAGPLRGGARDYAQAELARTKAAKLGDLIPGARRAAAEAGSNLGLGVVGVGTGATGNAGSLYSTLAGQQENRRQFDKDQSRRFSEDLGETLASGLQAKPQKGPKGASGRSLLPTSTSGTYAPPSVSGLAPMYS